MIVGFEPKQYNTERQDSVTAACRLVSLGYLRLVLDTVLAFTIFITFTRSRDNIFCFKLGNLHFRSNIFLFQTSYLTVL